MTDELPMEMIEHFWRDYVFDKVQNTILYEEPAGNGLRFVLDFGLGYREWPFYDPTRLEVLGVPIPQGSDDKLLAVFDANPEEQLEIILIMAKLLTAFGPPRVAIVYSDAFVLHVKPEETAEDIMDEVRTLVDDFTLNPHTRVQEALVCHATTASGRTWGRTMPYHYEDGNLLFDDPEDHDIDRSHGPLSSTLEALVLLHGVTDIRQMFLVLCDGDEGAADELLQGLKSPDN